jgi:site-specific recombinase XerD
MLTPNESPIPEYPCLRKLDELLPLRGLAATTHEQYRRFARKLAERAGRDPAELDEAAVRAHLLYCKTALNYAPSTMRAACAGLRFLYHTVLGRDWKLFDLVRCADHHRLPVVLTREEVARLFAVVRLPRFRTFLRLVYGSGLRLAEGLAMEVDSIKQNGTCLFIHEGKGAKDRFVPLPSLMLTELRIYWKTHRHPRLLFPGVGRGWRDLGARAPRNEAMSPSSVEHCMRLAVAEAHLPKGTCVHTLRHSYATHLLEAGVSLRQIAAYLGHGTLDTTVVYTHLTAIGEAKARKVIEGLLPELSPILSLPNPPPPASESKD